MKKVLVLFLIIAIIAGISYVLLSGKFSFDFGSSNSDDAIPVNATVTTKEAEVIEVPPSLLIEIHENNIIYNDEKTSLDELETILQKYENTDDIWILQDTYQASKSTYDEVKELLIKHNFVFGEK